MTTTMSGPDSPVTEPTPSSAPQRRADSKPPRPPRAPRPARAARPQDAKVAGVSSAVTMVALVTCWVFLQMLVLGGLSHERSQDLLYRDFRGQLANLTAPMGDQPIDPGTPVALVQVPAIGMDEVVVEGTASGDLLAGPGHVRSSVLPGQDGESVLMGRGASYGAPFGEIGDLQAGDPITVTVGQGVKTFTVLGVRRAGDPEPQPRPAGTARLTLISAEGEGRLAALSPGEVVYVDAEAPEAFGAPAGRPAGVPAAEKPMATDRSSALPLLSLCLALLLALTLAVVAARQRYSAVLVWVVATPVALALAWQTTDVVMRLLPNLV
ncbi:sortase [Nocardioides lianchengensis]|uniref:LPXTG-site transpeptidase (Sortase) family protein n=1 Tax=Nocardioides lianchengensis TaxID=1045774 RepID=A0A1G6VWS8_9ACTN|nr:class E sortase [Nocardioides lianchengensis]NYG11307.1 sortase A [Nocardioides lianchengensis]SDD57437.1 LPXTG-site transpeptidase (sortase) family protein [Nocardioides lianchengensis]